jgi:hypothetical protein
MPSHFGMFALAFIVALPSVGWTKNKCTRSLGEHHADINIEIEEPSREWQGERRRAFYRSGVDPKQRVERSGKTLAILFCKERGLRYSRFHWERTKPQGESNPYSVTHIVCANPNEQFDDDLARTAIDQHIAGNLNKWQRRLIYSSAQQARLRETANRPRTRLCDNLFTLYDLGARPESQASAQVPRNSVPFQYLEVRPLGEATAAE